jgi:DNA-binding NtrC family response regulator
MQGRARVLVIDDDEKLGKMVARMLAPQHDAVVLTRAKTALDHIAAGERFDLILCDLTLPGMSGMDFYERVSSIAPEMLDGVVIMTGGAFTPRAVELVTRGTICVLHKPFTLAQLQGAVCERLLRLAE